MPAVASAGYQHTLAQIRTKVRACLLETDSTNTTWSNAVLDVHINLAIDDVRGEGLVKQTSYDELSTSGDQTIITPLYVWKIVNILYDEEPLREMSLQEFNNLTGGDWDGSTGVPVQWWDSGDRVWFDCKMSSTGKTIHITYLEAPADLAGEEDLSGFYHTLTNVIVYRATAIAWAADSNAQQAQIWDAQYTRALAAALHQETKGHESQDTQVHDHVGGGEDY